MSRLTLTISVVLYKNKYEEIKQLISCISRTSIGYKLFLLDNSPTDDLGIFGKSPNIEYIFNDSNMGYGRAHNIAIQKAKEISDYHLILNPDITFADGVLENIYTYMEAHKDIGQLMPKIYYGNGELQRLCKLLPKPIDLIGRRFFNFSKWVQERNKFYELRDFGYDKVLDIPSLSGCFMFIRTKIFEEVKGFDPRYFMYLEDFDLTRRIHKVSRTVFYPYVSVEHGFHKGSYKNLKLLRHHVISAIKYFNKWGWVIDKERDQYNEEVIAQLT